MGAPCCKILKDEELSYLHAKCYPSILSLPLHREPYITTFHFNSFLTDHQIKVLKKRMRKVSPFLIYPLFCNLLQTYLVCLSALFFPNNIEESKITTTRIGHLCPLTKTSKNRQKKQNKKQKKKDYDKKFLVKQYIKSL